MIPNQHIISHLSYHHPQTNVTVAVYLRVVVRVRKTFGVRVEITT